MPRLKGTVVAQWGREDFDIAAVLGFRTRCALSTATRGDTFLIKQQPSGNLASATLLATGAPLNEIQIHLIKDLVAKPTAYYCGHPIFKRLPPRPDFAIQLQGGSDVLDLMIDLRNPSWGFYCAGEVYDDWNWVGHRFKDIAKQAFPQYASTSKTFVWRKGVIAELEAALNKDKN